MTNLPSTDDVFILCDGEPFRRFSVAGPNAIRLDTTIDMRHYQIFTGYRGPGARADEARRERPARGAATAGLAAAADRPVADRPPRSALDATSSFSATGPSCPCCVA